MANKAWLLAPLVLATSLAMVSCSGGPAAVNGSTANLGSMEPITLKVAETNAQGSAQGMALQSFADSVQEQTDGKVKFEIYWGGSLVAFAESLDAASSGLADITAFGGPNTPEKTPGLAWLSGLGVVQGDAWPLDYLTAQAATMNTALHNEQLEREFTANNVKGLWLGASPKAEMYCTSPVSTLEEAKGKRVRTYAPMWASAMEELGMVSVSMPIGEVYEALQRGVIDCATTPSGFASIPKFGAAEVAPYMTPLHLMGFVGNGYVINEDVWNGLPSDVQTIFNEASAVWAATMATTFVDQYSKTVQTPPAEITYVDARALNKVLDKYNAVLVDGFADSAPDSVTNPQAIVDQFKSSYEELKPRLVDQLGLPTTVPASPQEVKQAFNDGPTTYDPAKFGSFLKEIYNKN